MNWLMKPAGSSEAAWLRRLIALRRATADPYIVQGRRWRDVLPANGSAAMDGSFGSSFKPFNSTTRPFENWEGRVLKRIELAEEYGLKVIPELGRCQYQRDNRASLRWLETWVSS